MHPRWLIAVALTLTVIPAAASAAQETVMDFTGTQQPGRWEVTPGMEAVATAEGLRLRAQNDAGFFGAPATHPVDTLTFSVMADAPADIMFLWRTPGMEPGFRQMPLRLTGGQQDIHLGLSTFPGWSRQPEAVGIALRGGTAVTLARITSTGLTLPERLTEAWRTFWEFDTFGTYSVNFLWGPLVTFDPVSRARLYQDQPPMAQSANRYFFALLILAGLALWLIRLRRPDFRALPLFLGICAVLWVFYDLRMGAEYVNYALTDYRSYISQPPEERLFRQYENFHAAAFQAVPLLAKEERYAVLPPPQTQVTEILQYYTYPVLPARTEEEQRMARLWLVFRRPDVTVAPNGQLTVEDAPVTPPGKIIRQYDSTSFLFQVNP